MRGAVHSGTNELLPGSAMKKLKLPRESIRILANLNSVAGGRAISYPLNCPWPDPPAQPKES